MKLKHVIIIGLVILGLKCCIWGSEPFQQTFYPIKYWSREVAILNQECVDLRQQIAWLSAYDFHLQKQYDEIRDCKCELKVYEDALQTAREKLYEAQLKEGGQQP